LASIYIYQKADFDFGNRELYRLVLEERSAFYSFSPLSFERFFMRLPQAD